MNYDTKSNGFKEKLAELPSQPLSTSDLMQGWEFTVPLEKSDRLKLLSHIAQSSESIPDRLRAIDLLCKINKDFDDEKEDKFTIELVVSENDMKL